MKQLRFPIRLKILVSLLFGLTAVVIAITFTMATFFHQDKQSYMNDWISIAAVTTAQESRSTLQGYARQLEMGSRIALDETIPRSERQRLLRGVFDTVPELVEIVLYRDGAEIESARDPEALSQAGLTAQDLAKDRVEHPLPIDGILKGEPYVANSTLSEKLPCLTLAVALTPEGRKAPAVVAAVIRLEGLLQVGRRFRVFDVAIETRDGTLLAHADAGRVARREKLTGRPEVAGLHDPSRAGTTMEYDLGGTAMLGGFADAEFGGVAVAVQIPKAAAYLASRDLLIRLMFVAVLLLFVVAIGGQLWSRRVTRPLEKLTEATRQVAKGTFDIKVDVASRDEIGTLAASFNQMAGELRGRELALSEVHSQLIQSEKMAAFGQIGAGIAHEVKNPLAGILGCAQLSLMDVAEGTMVHKNLKLIEKETQRCKTIIENLMKFARQEKTLLEPTEVNRVVEDAVAIVNHQMEINQVRLEKDLAPGLPLVRGNGNQLQQVLMNLFVNAQQAMGGNPGQVKVTTLPYADGRVRIVVKDDGPGIPKEIQSKLFDPFFTTKPAGQGTGLGLSVSFGIVKDHGGEIAIQSEPGQGATFVITLPAMPVPVQPVLTEEIPVNA
jgi:signal transduction histidine kinase